MDTCRGPLLSLALGPKELLKRLWSYLKKQALFILQRPETRKPCALELGGTILSHFSCRSSD